MKVWLQEMRWEEVRDHLQKDDVVIIPVGSTEQHGTRLPLGTDSMVAIALAEDMRPRRPAPSSLRPSGLAGVPITGLIRARSPSVRRRLSS